MKNDFIPVSVETDNKKMIWYLDVSRLGIEELMNLKKELRGTLENSIRMLDKIIYSKVTINRNLYDASDSGYRKEEKRNNKKLKKRKKFGGKRNGKF